MTGLKRYEFTDSHELSEEAFRVYSDSSFAFYKSGDAFYVADNSSDEPWELGTLEDVEEYLLVFADNGE